MSGGGARSTEGVREGVRGVGDGRRNQKLRTRRALIDAAVTLLREGRTVTIADAAEAAQVSTATAYRYFSSPPELLQEAQTLLRTPDVLADLPSDPAQRLDTLVSRVADMQFGDEAMWRALLRASMERWLQQAEKGGEQGDEMPIRNRTRLDLTRTALEPLAGTLPPAEHRRLTMALMLVYGVETLVTTRDACGLDPEEAKGVMRWAAGALLETALRESGSVRG
ncbi:TetR/AcrR family transcriptional regulator [Streptomyces sp. NPDC005728]|uniref:TetR/AcrR family transcriptional regulator n=1 Tax=Streptomyces sp. NPDC005728 TaxID=3157054 RepID=UPI0033C252B9